MILIPRSLEEFGSSTTSHLFRKRLMNLICKNYHENHTYLFLLFFGLIWKRDFLLNLSYWDKTYRYYILSWLLSVYHTSKGKLIIYILRLTDRKKKIKILLVHVSKKEKENLGEMLRIRYKKFFDEINLKKSWKVYFFLVGTHFISSGATIEHSGVPK